MLNKAKPPPLPHSIATNKHGTESSYDIIDWFKKFLRNYANFSGRARRKEFWYSTFAQFVFSIIAIVLDAVIFGSLVMLGLFIPSLAVTVRRLHDTSRSGWWFLISLIPLIGSIILLIFLATETKFETNQWGPPAK